MNKGRFLIAVAMATVLGAGCATPAEAQRGSSKKICKEGQEQYWSKGKWRPCPTLPPEEPEEPPVLRTLSVGDVTVTEGGTAQVTVTASGTSTVGINFGWSTSPGTATAGADYSSRSGVLSIPAGTGGSVSISAPTINDTTDEPDESFNFVLGTTSGAIVNDPTGVALITDNDDPPPPEPDPAPKFYLGDVTVTEGGVAAVPWTKTNANGAESSIQISTINSSAVAPDDYTSITTSVTVPNGTMSGTVNVSTVNDTTDEPNESINTKLVGLSNADIVDSTGLITITDNDDPVVPPPPDGTGTQTPIASNFDINTTISSLSTPASSAAPDVVGAFRFICGPGQIAWDDPIVYPGQPGASPHAHQFFGNTAANGNSTYASLRATGGSTCNYITESGMTTAGNRSAYWMSAMYDGMGSIVRPEHLTVYYKSLPQNSTACNSTNIWGVAPNKCVKLPDGLRFIFGFDMLTNNLAGSKPYYNCQGPGSVPGTYPDIPSVAANCPVGAQVGVIITAPPCWDGKNLDSPDHRSHMAYPVREVNSGKSGCKPTHPYVVPTFTFQAWYKVRPGMDLSKWYLGSDLMRPNLPRGSTMHVDFFMAWDPTLRDFWQNGCINLMLSCASGRLDHTRILKRAGQPLFGGVASWTNPQPLVAPPAVGQTIPAQY